MVIDPKVAKAVVPDCKDVADCMDELDMACVSCGVRFSPVDNRDDGEQYTHRYTNYNNGQLRLTSPSHCNDFTGRNIQSFALYPPGVNIFR